MRPRSLWLLLLMISSPLLPAADPLSESRQCLVVTVPDWSSRTGSLQAFERSGDNWKRVGSEAPIVVGKNGMAWGKGIFEPEMAAGPRKVEGDNKATAGFFRLGPAFGYAPTEAASWIKFPYVSLTKEIEGVDDPRSQYYNQLVDRSKVARIDWRSSEKMLRGDELYKWGVFVAHNPAATPGAGSCIFLHIWRNASAGTAGCTAMSEQNLVALLRWLDPAAKPVLIQLPRSDYLRLQPRYELPALAETQGR